MTIFFTVSKLTHLKKILQDQAERTSCRLLCVIKLSACLVTAKLSISFKIKRWQGVCLHNIPDIIESPSWRTEKNIGLDSYELGGCGEVQLHWDTIHAIKKK